MNWHFRDSFLAILRRKLSSKKWRRTVTCLGAVVVFAVTYSLLLPAITMTGAYPALTAEKLSAWSGEVLTVQVTAEAPENEGERIFVLTAEGKGADLSPAYAFDDAGTCVITDDAGKEIVLHRSLREENVAVLVDYWFTLAAGEQTSFMLELADVEDSGRAAESVKLIRAQNATGSDALPAAAAGAAGIAGAGDVATGSNAGNAAAGAGTAQATGAAGAAGAVQAAGAAQPTLATPSAAETATPSGAFYEEADEDGFVELLDGAIVNDLGTAAGSDRDGSGDGDAEDEGSAAQTVAELKLSGGAGADLEAAAKDAARNASKRGNAELKFSWKDVPAERLAAAELSGRIGDVSVTVLYDETAGIPAGARLSLRELTEDDEEYDSYAERTRAVVEDPAAGKAAGASSGRVAGSASTDSKADAATQSNAEGTEARGTAEGAGVLSTGEGAEVRGTADEIAAEPRTMVGVRLLDISIVDEAGNEIEPASDVKVVITYDEALELPEDGGLDIVHFKDEGETLLRARTAAETAAESGMAGAEAVGNGAETGAAGTAESGEVSGISFVTDSFSIFALAETRVRLLGAAAGMDIDGTTYYPFSSISVTPATGTSYKGEDFQLNVEFTMEDLPKANFYAEIPCSENDKGEPIVDYTKAKGKMTLDGEVAGDYEVKVVGDAGSKKAYLLIRLDQDHASGSAASGQFAMMATAVNEGRVDFDGSVIEIKKPEEKKYDNLVITKGASGPAPVLTGDNKGDFIYTFTVVLRNNGNEAVTPDAPVTVYDVPLNFDDASGKAPFTYYWKSAYRTAYLQYPETIPGADGNTFVLTRGTTPVPGAADDRQKGFVCSNVTIPAGGELKWTYEVVLTKEEAAALDTAEQDGSWTNLAGFYRDEKNKKEVEKTVTYAADKKPLDKIGRVPEGKAGDMEWTVKLETSGKYDASGSWISDTLNTKLTGDLHYITTDEDERPYVIVYTNGKAAQEKKYLTWVKVDDALIDRVGTSDDTIYYDDNGHFRWYSKDEAEGANYGYELHYWTNFKEEWLDQDSINQTASNFSDRTGHGVDGKYDAAVSFVKRLERFEPDNRYADWSITMPIRLSHPATGVQIADYLPNGVADWQKFQEHMTDTMAYMESDRQTGEFAPALETDGGEITIPSGETYHLKYQYWEFASAVDFEEFTGIRITVTDIKTGEVIPAEQVLGVTGKIGFHTRTAYDINGRPAGGVWRIQPNSLMNNGGKASVVNGYGVSNCPATLPAGEYTIRLDYRTFTPGPGMEAAVNVNYAFLRGTTSAGNSFDIDGTAAYSLTPTFARGRLEKKIAKVVRTDEGKFRITYMSLIDNRSDQYNKDSIATSDQYLDTLSGLPAGQARLIIGDEKKLDGVHVYKIPVTKDENDPTGWSMTKADSMDDLLAHPEVFPEIVRPVMNTDGQYWGGLSRYGFSENGFSLYIYNGNHINKSLNGTDAEKAWAVRTVANIFSFAEGTEQWKTQEDFDNFNFKNVTKSSYYFVYDVEVSEKDLAVTDVLRNTIDMKIDGRLVDSSYQDYAVLLNELRKTVIEKPTTDNNYVVTFGLDLKMTDSLKLLENVTISDKMTSNLELDVQSLELYRVDRDGKEHRILPDGTGDSKESFTALYADHELSIRLNKAEEGDWADQYAIRYKAALTQYEGRTHYGNYAMVPDGKGIPSATEGEVFVKRPEGTVTNLTLDIYKYDGNSTEKALQGAGFSLHMLKAPEASTQEAPEESGSGRESPAGEGTGTSGEGAGTSSGGQTADYYAVLRQMAADGKSADEIEAWLNGEGEGAPTDDDWEQFDSEKITGSDGKAAFGTYRDSDEKSHSILYNRIYRLKETKTPEGYEKAKPRVEYFMFYGPNFPSHADVEGLQNLIRSYARETTLVQVPNYKTSFSVYKVDAEEKKTHLSGFKFHLYADAAMKENIPNYAHPEGMAATDHLYFPDIPVPPTGTVTYYLKETEAPENHIKDPKRAFLVTVAYDGTLSFAERVIADDGSLRELTPEEKPSLIGSDSVGLTISNEPNSTEFSFDKIWLTNDTAEEWPEDVKEITVTLKRTAASGDGAGSSESGESSESSDVTGSTDETGSGKTREETVTFKVQKVMNQPLDLRTVAGSRISGIVTQVAVPAEGGKRYSWKITGLDNYVDARTAGKEKGTWTYTISEAQIEGFNEPKYIKKGETAPTGGLTDVGDGGTIRNDRYTTSLPSTGGPGTTRFLTCGLLLVLGAILVGLKRRIAS